MQFIPPLFAVPLPLRQEVVKIFVPHLDRRAFEQSEEFSFLVCRLLVQFLNLVMTYCQRPELMSDPEKTHLLSCQTVDWHTQQVVIVGVSTL